MERLVELVEAGIEGQLGNLQSAVVFGEFDDVWISRQREKRRKAGAVAAGGQKIGKKPGKRPMHVGTALATICELAMDARDEPALEKLVKLYSYFLLTINQKRYSS